MFIIAIIVILLLYARVFLIDRASTRYRTNSIIVFVPDCVGPFILRLTMPLLPE
ncbi:MAG: hypothetical protein ACE5EO_04480 [Candidatus Krumholzibacteriia bacterium]